MSMLLLQTAIIQKQTIVPECPLQFDLDGLAKQCTAFDCKLYWQWNSNLLVMEWNAKHIHTSDNVEKWSERMREIDRK